MSTSVSLFKDPERQALFEADGFSTFPLFPAHVVEELLEQFARIEPGVRQDPDWRGRRVGEAPPGAAVEVGDREDGLEDLCYVATPELRREVHGALREIARPYLDKWIASYEIVGATFMNKGPRARSIIALHQGWNWVDERDGQYSAQLWCPLVETEQGNGGLGVVPGSHHLEWAYRAVGDDSPFREHFALLIREYYRACSAHAGEAIMFHARLVHGSARNWINAHRPVAVIVVAPTTAKAVHYIRADAHHVRAYSMSPHSSDTLVAGEPPEGEALLGTIEHEVVLPTEAQVRALLDRPVLGPAKGGLPDERTVADLLETIGEFAEPAGAFAAAPVPAPRTGVVASSSGANAAEEFARLFWGSSELPLALGDEWRIMAISVGQRADSLTLVFESQAAGTFQAWIERKQPGGRALATTRFLAIGHGALPSGASSYRVGEVLRELADRLRAAEERIQAADLLRVFPAPPA